MAIRSLNGVGIHVVENPARLAAGWLIHTASEPGHVALSGGSTIGRAYELAAELQPEWRSDVHLWFGDERAVPPADERSNYRLVRETLLDRLRAQPTVHRIHGELGAPDAAELYDRELDGVTLDLALNGIGADGHTASLFPDAPALDEQERRVGRRRAGAGAVRGAGDADAADLRLDPPARLPRHRGSRRPTRSDGRSPRSRAPRRRRA